MYKKCLGRHDSHQNLEYYYQHCAISPNFKSTKSSAANKKSLVGKKRMAGSLFGTCLSHSCCNLAPGIPRSHAFAPCVFMGVRKTSQLGVRDRAAASTQALGPMSMVHPSTTRRARCTWGQYAGSPSNPQLIGNCIPGSNTKIFQEHGGKQHILHVLHY